jgi:hypothetical protein
MTAATIGKRTADDTGSTTGALYLITARGAGGQFFLGRATCEPEADRLTLEGKALCAFSSSALTVQPFSTCAVFPCDDPRFALQRLEHPAAIDEGTRLLTLAIPRASHTGFPLLFRWFQASMREGTEARRAPAVPASGAAAVHLFDGFRRHAAGFRRALIQSPQVTTSHELDKLTELEGDLAIEMSKGVNAIAAALNALLARENDLAHFLDQLGGQVFPASDSVGGWTIVAGRLEAARSFALRNANTPLVREVNALSHEGFQRLAERILEHESALDTLVAETLGNYGIQAELWGDAETPVDRTPLAPIMP